MRDLVALTKPRIISLLLVTTIAPMFVAGRPSWTLVLAVFVGGYLMAGGANAVNMYMDRDIDDRMSRTRLRPIPSGRMQPREVLAFGILLSTTATWLLAQAANVLTAALALAGFYFYVFVYTRWLKRSTPQNIVIGGAAGAFPPLVGWAAVTNRVDLFAVYLFLIIFYWTPPHFWALALLKQKDYGTRRRADGAAGVGRARDEAADVLVHVDSHSAHAASRSRSACSGRSTSSLAALLGAKFIVRGGARDARRRLDKAGVAPVQVLAALPRAALRRDGRRPPGDHRLTSALPSVADRVAPALRSPKPLGRLLPRLRPFRAPARRSRRSVSSSRPPSGSIFPQVVRHLLDAAFQQHDRALLDRIALGLIALFALQGVMNFIQVYLLTSTTERVIAALREDVFAHLVRLSPGFFTERRTGELTSRLSADLAVLQSLMSTWISEMSRQILFLVGGIVLLTLTHPRLTDDDARRRADRRRRRVLLRAAA